MIAFTVQKDRAISREGKSQKIDLLSDRKKDDTGFDKNHRMKQDKQH